MAARYSAINDGYWKKLERSHLGEWMDGVFLSEKLGALKPSPAFFEKVVAALGDVPKADMLIVGDSLTSDMAGGLMAGIPTCWYNPDRQPRPADMAIDHEITDLHQIFDLL